MGIRYFFTALRCSPEGRDVMSLHRVLRSSAMRRLAAIPQRGGAPAALVPGSIEPPHFRLPLPKQDLLEEDELIWNDGVAPEACLDFDAPHVSSYEALAWWFGGIMLVYLTYRSMGLMDLHSWKKTAPRELPESTRLADGLYEEEAYAQGPQMTKRAE